MSFGAIFIVIVYQKCSASKENLNLKKKTKKHRSDIFSIELKEA